MNIRIPNHRGWRARQDVARAKAEAKADPFKIARGKLLHAMSRRDTARGDVQRAENAVANAADQVCRLQGTVDSSEAWSVGALKLHPGLVPARMQVQAAQEIHALAVAALDAARARATAAEAAFLAASGRFIADTATSDESIEVMTPAAIEPAFAARVVAPVAMVPATVDAGVALDRDAAIAALEPVKRGRRR